MIRNQLIDESNETAPSLALPAKLESRKGEKTMKVKTNVNAGKSIWG
jgi:hypothetical protein